MKYLLGLDVGSSFVKAALVDADTGKTVALASSPHREMPLISVQPGFAEQDPESWWSEVTTSLQKLRQKAGFRSGEVIAVGISYQMHGLVCLDKQLAPLRPAIIWCDSRAVDIGNRAFDELGHAFCLSHYLNSPGNFTASKLRWVQQNEPKLFEKIFRVLLPGDYIALKLTGEAVTTLSGLSEGIFWDYQTNELATDLMNLYQFDSTLLAPRVPTFGLQGRISKSAADSLGLDAGTPISYRAGDQPNNAFSLRVLSPGQLAATAGTSGVIYAVSEEPRFDSLSRVNSFVHVNHHPNKPRYGILLCINGTGILNSWIKKNFFNDLSYDQINAAAALAPVGSSGLQFFPFGNGAERILSNFPSSAILHGLQFARHDRNHVARAAQEGIVFAMNYGAEIMKGMGLELATIRAGHTNMFLSPVFSATLANVSDCIIELYNTDGAVGAARGAGLGVEYYGSEKECFSGMDLVQRIEPNLSLQSQTRDMFEQWKDRLLMLTQQKAHSYEYSYRQS